MPWDLEVCTSGRGGESILLWKHLLLESKTAKMSIFTTQPCWQNGNVPLHPHTDPEQPGRIVLWSHQYLQGTNSDCLSIRSLLQVHSDTYNLLELFFLGHAGCTGETRGVLLVSCHADSSSSVALAPVHLESSLCHPPWLLCHREAQFLQDMRCPYLKYSL